MIACCCHDLLWESRIAAAAARLGVSCRPVRSADQLRALMQAHSLRLLIVELDSPEAWPCLALAARARDAEGRPAIIAFGPHVDRQQFRRARQAGADKLFSRGAFARRMGEVLAEWYGAGGPADPPAPTPRPD